MCVQAEDEVAYGATRAHALCDCQVLLQPHSQQQASEWSVWAVHSDMVFDALQQHRLQLHYSRHRHASAL